MINHINKRTVSTISIWSKGTNISNILPNPSPCIIFILNLLCIDAIIGASYITILGAGWENYSRIVAFYWLLNWRGFALSWIQERTGKIERFFCWIGLNSAVCLHVIFWANCIIALKSTWVHYFSATFEENKGIIILLSVILWKDFVFSWSNWWMLWFVMFVLHSSPNWQVFAQWSYVYLCF